MDPKFISAIMIVFVAILVGMLVLWAIARNQRIAKLRSRFGSEYDRTARMTGTRKAEILLMERAKRVESFPIRQIEAHERDRFTTEWRIIQSRFVDNPRGAVGQADLLVERLMHVCGYPVSDFEQRAADLSVAHPEVVDNYRAAHQIALRHKQGRATTEDLRNALIYYRTLFEELLHIEVFGPQKEVA